ncbi:hypothetical protein BOO22_14820 [Vibrio cidicii]|uniref:hypothetical protein n=1 Tax=Vibrio cidicii TaxID=1763883 RepID=UPI0018C20C48|nr:hypothetical protein [Vibrio cidicii]MBG0760685.1 hypothetical protein [Vibrio cidicii]
MSNNPTITSIVSNYSGQVLVADCIRQNGNSALSVNGVLTLKSGDSASNTNIAINPLNQPQLTYIIINGVKNYIWWHPAPPLDNSDNRSICIMENDNRTPIYQENQTTFNFRLTINEEGNFSFMQE